MPLEGRRKCAIGINIIRCCESFARSSRLVVLRLGDRERERVDMAAAGDIQPAEAQD